MQFWYFLYISVDWQHFFKDLSDHGHIQPLTISGDDSIVLDVRYPPHSIELSGNKFRNKTENQGWLTRSFPTVSYAFVPDCQIWQTPVQAQIAKDWDDLTAGNRSDYQIWHLGTKRFFYSIRVFLRENFLIHLSSKILTEKAFCQADGNPRPIYYFAVGNEQQAQVSTSGKLIISEKLKSTPDSGLAWLSLKFENCLMRNYIITSKVIYSGTLSARVLPTPVLESNISCLAVNGIVSQNHLDMKVSRTFEKLFMPDVFFTYMHILFALFAGGKCNKNLLKVFWEYFWRSRS